MNRLYKEAARAAGYRELNEYTSVGAVAAAIETEKGNIYRGICIDAPCGIGFCAEHSAIAAMVTAGETRIVKMAAVKESGEVIPPCGRCRELIYQIDHRNLDCAVLLENGETTIKALLPELWNE